MKYYIAYNLYTGEAIETTSRKTLNQRTRRVSYDDSRFFGLRRSYWIYSRKRILRENPVWGSFLK